MKYIKLFEDDRQFEINNEISNEYLDKFISNYLSISHLKEFNELKLFSDIARKISHKMEDVMEKSKTMKSLSKILLKRVINQLTKSEISIIDTWDKFYPEYERFKVKLDEVNDMEAHIIDSDDSEFQIYLTLKDHGMLSLSTDTTIDIIRDIKNFELDTSYKFNLEFNNGYIGIKVNENR